MASARRPMVISSLWLQTAILTFIIGFAILTYLAVRIQRDHPPVPATVVADDGTVLFTGDDVMAGQHLFQKYGLMQFGTIFGHGAYLGPDFTAQFLHAQLASMQASYASAGMSPAEASARIKSELKRNTYDQSSRVLRFGAGQSNAFGDALSFYRAFFGDPERQAGVKRVFISNQDDVRRLTAYFAWSAWVSSAARPGADYSYTNNWPPEALAGNAPTVDAFLWSVLSLIALLGGTGMVLFAVGRWNLLGWHPSSEEDESRRLTVRPPELVRLTAAQRATPWYFLVVAALFLLQGLLGGANAHYHVEPSGFYGLNIAAWLPYNLSRTWHLQLALFFVSASFLAIGIFIAPMIGGREPRHQATLAGLLFVALVIVVLGSLAGEAASYKDYIAASGPWFWIGAQGWEYLDLGRLWQILLVVGMLLWVAIVFRGIAARLRTEHPGNMPFLFLYSAISIPLFYAAGLAFGKGANFAVMDFWRFWVVHLWVEDFLELFTTIMVAYMFVLMGVVRPQTATRVVYLDIVLYSIGGVVGTMHHLYFSGAPSVHMALGAFFSAMEVIPLLLLTFEAWRFMQLGGVHTGHSVIGEPGRNFPHKWAVMFLIAVGFWNFLGAGVFGFLINLPIVSYYEIGTQFTANHAHGAMMGVYGMLAIGFLMFVARHFVAPDKNADRAMRLSFWSLNIGLALMVVSNLVPIGILQLYDSFKFGYWHAREPAFFAQPAVRLFEWLRLPGDAIFIVGGILPVVYIALRMFAGRNRPGQLAPMAEADTFTEVAG